MSMYKQYKFHDYEIQVTLITLCFLSLGANLIISAGLGIVVATEAAWILNTFQVGQWKLGASTTNIEISN